ncbi:MAG: hypothetical protein ABI778_08615 [Ignavibacteriota bacterium]
MRELTKKETAEFKKLYAKGESIKDLQLHFHIRRTTLLAIAKKMGVIRKRGRPKSDS